ncbi:hypothetical protein K402DRAFT_301296, partial [Aulographum hederae CBS 113979]
LLVPLYIFPESTSTWDPVFSAASSFPNLTFYVIVNPDSGPGSSLCPETEYSSAIEALNDHANVQAIGYVDTNFTHRPLERVERDIEGYSNWEHLCRPNSKIKVTGIFFDDVSDDGSNASFEYLNTATGYARANLSTVVYNPGVPLPETYYSGADLIVGFEDPYSDYHGQASIDKFNHFQPSKNALIIHSVP